MTAVRLSYKALVEQARAIIEATLRDPDAAVHVEKASRSRPAFVVVSQQFEGRTQRERQDMLWPALEAELGADATRISIIFARTWDEVK